MDARWIRLGAIEPPAFEQACASLAAAQGAAARPILAWAQAEAQYLFAVIAPRRLAPGLSRRWLAWALAPAVATYRQFDMPAYLDAQAIWLHGREIAGASVREIGTCVVVASSFLRRFPEQCVSMPSSALEDAFRLRLEAQHGWRFDHSWLTEPERALHALA
ncbi:MAG TPA: hypothetical protein VML57_13410 [Burkholderiales bacterium]|jgi:hypothetical protein|nr:hypothetical protein [Burkholderiales bacterium]